LVEEGWISIDRLKRGPANHKAFLTSEGKKIVKLRKRDFEFLFLMKDKDSYVFTSDRKPNQMLRRQTITMDVNKVMHSVSNLLPSKPKITSHSFRIGYISQLWKDTKDIEFVRQTIGHRSLNSTSGYVTDMGDEERQNRIISSDEMTSEEQEKLINSLLAKIPEHSYQETSINKFFKKFLKFIDPVISDHKFWRILSESKKPIKSQLSGPSEVRSTDILVPSQNGPDKQAKTRSKGSSSFFAEALSIPNTRKLSPMHKRVQLNMSKKETNFSNKLESSGLSKNHEELPQNIQYIEIKTRLRRAQPLYSSEVLGNSYEYGGKQLERKAPRHLPDFGISIVGKSIEELAVEYKDLVETILSKQGLVVRKDGTLNKQEPTINMGDPETLGIVAFEKNPLYDKHRFISSYPVSQEAFDHFVETGEIGLSPEEKKTKIDAFQKKQAQAERERTTARSFYSSLPEDARIGNQQLREVEGIQERLKEDPNSPLTEKEKNLIQRAENYQRYKDQFYQNNPDIDRDEL
jgi:hypothetical protein